MKDLQREVVQQGVVASIGRSTLWRWLSEDAIKPWTHRSWVFPRDPDFSQKAGRILDLYEGLWDGESLSAGEFVLSADEKPSIQARRRKHPSTPPDSNRPMRVEHEYSREGAWTYIAAWDVRHAKVFGSCVPKAKITDFDELVDSVMCLEPYRSAKRVFWIVDNSSIHRGQRCVRRFQGQWPNTTLVHTPNHASWLNQVEIYFSVLQRKVLTPNDFSSLDVLRERIAAFETYYQQIAKPFRWKFTRKDLNELLQKLAKYETPLATAA